MLNKNKIFHEIFGGDTPQERALLIRELEQEPDNPFITIRLTKPQVRKLAGFITMLPLRDFRALALHYCSRYTQKKLQKELKEQRVYGLIRYLKDRLTQCMGLGRPIAEWYWYRACSKALDAYFDDKTE